MRRPGIKPGSRPWQGRILSLYYRRTELSIPRLELGTSRVLGERHDQLDHTDQPVEYQGFDPCTSCLRSTHASDCANTPCFSGRVVPKKPHDGTKLTKVAKINLRHGESNPGHLRDRQRCYQLYHDGRVVSLQRGSNSRPCAY